MDVYRTSAIVCPSCPGASLREFQDRYVCDECQGILIGFDDFATACGDLVGELPTLEYRDEQPTTKPCPQCERALVACKVKLVGSKSTKLRDEFLRCERHGLWCGSGVLAAAFALVSRRIVNASSPDGPYTVGMDGIPLRDRGAIATDRLVISRWRNRPRQRTKTLTPINAYADRELPCPVCKTSLVFVGDRYACATCNGSFVETAAVVAMVSDVANQLWEMPTVTGPIGERQCPMCGERLVVETLVGTAIDRCPTHGVWFDASELAATLERASGALDRGLGPWLKRLFTREEDPMTDPYRGITRTCPSCKQGLREHQTRLVCDGCGGMMVPLDDLSKAIVEMTSLPPTFEIVDESPGKRTCPSCVAALTTCKLRIVLGDELEKPRPRLDRCTVHGLWFDANELAAVFEKVAGKGLGGGGAGMKSSKTGASYEPANANWAGGGGVPVWWKF